MKLLSVERMNSEKVGHDLLLTLATGIHPSVIQLKNNSLLTLYTKQVEPQVQKDQNRSQCTNDF